MEPGLIHVMLADDHEVVLDGLRSQLAGLPDIAVVATARSFTETIAVLSSTDIDVLVLDLGNMGGSPLNLMRRFEREHPLLQVVIFSSTIDLAPELIEAGASGYVAKEDFLSELVQAIRTIARGGQFYSQAVAAYLERRSTTVNSISTKEFMVLKLLAQGLSTSSIAEQMGIDPRSVQNHITMLRQKTNCEQRTQLVDWYRRIYGSPEA